MTQSLPLNRRSLLLTAGAAVSFSMFCDVASAQTPAPRKLVVIICRGGMDGLSVSPPRGDPNYAALRGPIAIGEEGLGLDSTFALHPALATIHTMAKTGEARIAPAVASPDRARSHFEAQDVLESGAGLAYGASSGWLNRAVEALAPGRRVEALSVGATAPLILRGKVEAASWSPGGAMDSGGRLAGLLQDLYRDDPLLGPALAKGLATEALAQSAMRAADATGPATLRPGPDAARRMGATLAGFMQAPGGPQVAAIELDGFDTHANQGAAQGVLAGRLAYLDALTDGLKTQLGPDWRNTVVVIATEFGRTARVNGGGGTDHGTASTALLLGGALKPGGIVGEWPGLRSADLFEGRDLTPTLDIRSLFKGVLAEHLGVDRRALDASVFPDSSAARALTGLVRA